MKSMMLSPRVMSSFFVVVAIAAALFSYWHSMSKLRPDYLQEIIMVDNSTLSDNRNENYLIGYSENADNITTYAEQIMTAYPEIELLYLYPKTKAIAVANVSPNCLKFIRTMSDILYIEPDFHVQAMRVQDDLNKTLEWGIDRIDGKLDNKYHYDYTGRGVRVYVIDSGIRFNHTEFRRSSSSESNESSKSRARCGTNFRKNKGESCLDDWGHGTHVAALIGGQTYGVAKDVQLFAVKVFGADGSSRFSDIVAAVEYVIDKKGKNPNIPMVANLSLGTARVSRALNRAVDKAVKAGITVVVAAGNGGVNACTYSPASASLAIAVAASTVENDRLSYSNWGRCVDIYAPGEKIWSAWTGDNSAGSFQTGTSSASPYVAGAVALYLERNQNMTPAEIKKALQNDAISGVLKNKTDGKNFLPFRLRSETPNLLLNVGVFVSDPPP